MSFVISFFWRRNHIERVHSEEGRPAEYQCAHCGREFKCKTTYTRHKRHESTYHGNVCL